MKHLTEYEHLNEAKVRKTIQQIRLGTKFNPYSVANDKFLREVYCCKEDAPRDLTKGQKYKLYAEFETGAMISNRCFVVLTNNNHFIGFDSEYFVEEYQWDAKKYNI
jgi:hypothetical protein